MCRMLPPGAGHPGSYGPALRVSVGRNTDAFDPEAVKRVPSSCVHSVMSGFVVFSLSPRVYVLDLGTGNELTFATPFAFLLQVNLWEMVQRTDLLEMVVVGILICFSLFSW